MNPDECPDDDSPDLTDEEIANAIPTTSMEDFARVVRDRFGTCVCGSIALITHATLRRRKPHRYSRVKMACDASNHQSRITFVVDWLV